MTEYLPEGFLFGTAENDLHLKSMQTLLECKQTRRILEAPCVVCDSEHNLLVEFPDNPNVRGLIPREEGAIGIAEGTTKDIALISRVNKPVCFVVKDIFNKGENTIALLSRKEAQLRARQEYISKLKIGDVIPAKVTHLEQFGCFVDIGCGIPSLIPIDLISVSRISHPSDRFYVGQEIRAVVKSFDDDRICLTHKELLGSWEENASLFRQGETVTGIVRSIEDYGIFVELAPNLAGLAEPRGDICVNDHASVYIKSIIPEKMKIKLIIVNTSDKTYHNNELNYFISSGHIDRWTYSTNSSAKHIETVFDE
ncbi:MAG: S1 RNA-binding domain-containing protein [Oscillospiraceae bacterium]